VGGKVISSAMNNSALMYGKHSVLRRVQKMKDKPSPFSNMTSFGRSLGLLLAAVVLVGSIALLVLNYAHQRTTAPGTLAPIIKSIPILPTPTPTASLSSSVGKTLYTTPANTAGFNGIAWSPDSKRVASLTSNGVQIWDATDGNNLVTVQIPNTYETPGGIDWSHNSQMLAVVTNHHVLLVDGYSGKVLQSYTPEYITSMIPPVSSGISYLGSQFPDSGGFAYLATAWSPDGQLMATATNDASQAVQIWNTQTGITAFTLTVSSSSYIVSAVSWSADGQYIAADIWSEGGPNVPDNTVIVWKVSTHQMVFQHKDLLGNIYVPIVWQPGSHNLAFVGGTLSGNSVIATLEIWNAETATLVKQYVGSGVGALAWSPDGHYVAYADFVKDTNTQVVTIRDTITDKKVYTYAGHKYPISEIVWSPNGRYILSSEGNKQGEVTQGNMVAKVWMVE
jgi:WD40 repeat protein